MPMIIMRSGFALVFRCGAIDSQSFVTFATSDAFLHDSATAVTPGCFL